jgi:YggT family protein
MPVGIIGFIFFILNGFLSFLFFCLVARAILSWLTAFNVLNTRNPMFWQVANILDRITDPVLEPFRRLIPSIGGIDLSFLFACLVIKGVQYYLLPMAATNLQNLING